MTTCLITGASRGIGLELARHYAEAGAAVIAAVRSPTKCAELLKLKAAFPKMEIATLDVADPASCERLGAALARRPLDLVVANAGVSGPRGGYADPANSAEVWAETLRINVTGVFFTIRALAPSLIAAKGKVAIISSRMGSSTAASGSSYLYRASKAAAANLGANFAVEFKPQGVAVGIYHPGWVKTDMGGQGADITVEVSAKGLAKRFAHLSLATTGVFEDYAGARIAF